MRLYFLEMKRVLSTRMTWILLIAAVALAALMAYMPLTFVGVSYLDGNGNRIDLKGKEAFIYINEVTRDYTGEITTEKVKMALKDYQECVALYGNIHSEDFPLDVYMKKIFPSSFLRSRISEAFSDADTGEAADLMELKPVDAEKFYEQCSRRLINLMRMEQENYPDAQEKALNMYERVKMPFEYYPYTTDVMDYLELYLYLLVIICTVIAAPVFSSDYQTGADDILRCTKYGKLRLAVTKLLSAITIFILTFALCLLIHVLISNSIFGWDGRNSSMQIVYSVSSLLNVNMGQLQNLVIMAGFITMLATISFVLFISSRCKNTATTLILGLLMCLIPIILYIAVGGVNVTDWIRCILPSDGVGLQNSFLYSVTDFNFLHIGGWSIWSPYVMVIAAVIEIPVFLIMALYSYCRRSD